MSCRRWISLVSLLLTGSLAVSPARAQVATAGQTSTGFAGGANSSGGYGTSVPLDLPAVRGGVPLPLQISYSEHGFGAAGLGWDIPLTYIRRDTTLARRRPAASPNVAPQAREQVSLMLGGRRLELVRTASAWVARHDAPDIEARENGDNTWTIYDGQGRTYLFAAPSTLLAGTGIWLLQDIRDQTGSRVHLEYSITAPSLPGGTAVAIDLTAVRYNSHPTTADCYKNSVNLAYDAAGAPLSASVFGTKTLVRVHKLVAVDVTGRESCAAGEVRLRHYQLAYLSDADTRQPRLRSVELLGRAGTPEATTVIPVATYTYGAASSGGQLTYEVAQSTTLPSLGLTSSNVPLFAGMGTGFSTNQMLFDVTGDGRPDFISYSDLGELSVKRNQFDVNAASFAAERPLSDSTLSPRPLQARTGQQQNLGGTVPAYNRVWRQASDVNGDGRVDIIDAAEQAGHWVVYLNTPDPSVPSGVRWQRRSYAITALAQRLTDRGYSGESGFLPLARSAVSGDGVVASCWEFFANGPKPVDGGTWIQVFDGPSDCAPPEPPLLDKTITEWQLRDVNGDGYPDVVFNSSPAIVRVEVISDDRDPLGAPGAFAALVESHTLTPRARSTNRIEAIFNVVGTRLTNGDAAFSAPVTLRTLDACGVEQWVSDSQDSRHLQCGLADVNGDGIADRVQGSSVSLGTGVLDAPGFFAPGAMITLPGPLAISSNNQRATCVPPANGNTFFFTEETAGLSDVTGDGIPDYLARSSTGAWSVSIGTGVSFAGSIPVNASSGSLSLSRTRATCSGASSTTVSQLLDIDGDGRLDVVSGLGDVRLLVGSDGAFGAPSAGRLIAIENGFGAKTNIRYRSVKGDSATPHQVPFPEVVVDSVETVRTQGAGGKLSTTRYAYGGAELMFDPTHESFTFPGYRRSVVLQEPVAQPAGVATIMITDTYGPVSAVDPYGLSGGAIPDAQQRYGLLMRAGRTRDTTVLSGNFGVDAVTTKPNLLLGIDVTTDSRRIAGTHFEWSTRPLAAASDPAGPEPCSEIVLPYDHAGSTSFATSHESYDPCKAHGFTMVADVDSWRGAPGAAPPASANVETRTQVMAVDGYGRVLSTRYLNDVHRSEDDLCVDVTYAAPTGSNERVLSASSSRTTSNCATTVYARDLWEYDNLGNGSVTAGLLTSHRMERRDDTGALLETIRQFDATYDATGNLSGVTSTREDGATRSVSVVYDPFGLAVRNVTTTATAVPTTQLSITRDPVTLGALTTTEPNGTSHGVTFDGFDRTILSTVTPPGGSPGAVSAMTYLGFSGGDSLGRRIVQKVFTDPVDPTTVSTAVGRTSMVYLDELGRELRTELTLGANYPDQTLIVGHRIYDSLGRVSFEADPYPSSQSFTTAYGTTRFFHADGTLSCLVRASGPQSAAPAATDETHEILPTCLNRVFQDNTEVVGGQRARPSLVSGRRAAVRRHAHQLRHCNRPPARSLDMARQQPPRARDVHA